MLDLETTDRPGALNGSLADVLAPLTLEAFLAHHWQQRHHVARADGTVAGNKIFGFEDLDHYLLLASRDPKAHLQYGGAKHGGKKVAIRDIELQTLYRAVAQGSTVQLSAIERYWPAAAAVADDFARAFCAKVKVNVYLTPAGHQGAPVHGDLQDVFVYQMEGEKDWYLYEETIFEPVETLGWARELAPDHDHLSQDAPLLEQTTVRPGDLLYLPRGLVHRAVASDTAPSVHLAICVTPQYWIDFLKNAFEVVAAEQPDLNRALDPRHVDDPAVREEARQTFSRLIDLLREEASFDRTADVLAQRRAASERLPADGHFSQVLRLEAIDAETRVGRRAGLSCEVEVDDEHAIFRFAGGEVKTTSVLGPALTFVRDHATFRVGDLPDLPEDVQCTLVRRLISGGFLRAAAEAAVDPGGQP